MTCGVIKGRETKRLRDQEGRGEKVGSVQFSVAEGVEEKLDARGRRSAQRFDVGVVQDEAVGRDDGQILEPRSGDGDAVCGITMDGIG